MSFWRVEAVTPLVQIADVEANKKEIVKRARAAQRHGVKIEVFPELSLTGYSCGDLFRQQALLDAAEAAILELAEELPKDMLVVVGAPLRIDGGLFNCAVSFFSGAVVGITTKTYLPTYEEYDEKRWFRARSDLRVFSTRLGESNIMLDQLLTLRDTQTGETVTVGIEICEDLWVPASPSSFMAQSGAEIILNLCAATEGAFRGYRTDLVRMQSSRCIAAYVMALAGVGESTTDTVCAGSSVIYENGRFLGEVIPFQRKSDSVMADIDVDALRYKRHTMSSFRDMAEPYKACEVDPLPLLIQKRDTKVLRPVASHPFLPQSKEEGRAILQTQAAALARRLEHVGGDQVVLGVSGGLDSTLALLVCCEAFDMLGLSRKGIHGITMPGLGTSDKTKDLASDLMRSLKISTKTISIAEATTQHLKDIGHDVKKTDVVFENAQARERTQVIMDYANKVNGLVVGTGDLSELALGWCTYNGDHMSMYGVNAGVPKTLVRYLVALYGEDVGGRTGKILTEVVNIPISPELLPADAKGNIAQKTEDIIGPYELHDFFLYHMVTEGATPEKIYALAKLAFGKDNPNGANVYTASTIKKWLLTFYRRFFVSQFKRSCMPDGPKVGPVSLSPRGGWKMPSDACMTLWMEEAKAL